MPDNNTLIAVSAFSGLAGALLTQTLTGLFTYYSDKRKSRLELHKQYRDKKIEIAENFYFMTGETMSILKKSVNIHKNRNDSRSESSLKFLSSEIKKLDAHLKKLNEKNWKHNLMGLYFNISLSFNEIMEANTRSHILFLKYLDISDKITKAAEADKEALYGQYNITIFDLCMQYDDIYNMLEKDMNKVKAELLDSFTGK
ncbi:hypothetical protein [Mucilaginibacter pocheonensis]|uniref:Uncharacterized protein n=1 Tax=Mucilaginibacter pocheonensis TaxID=398050 RepID=A0ABU1TCC4_9SPHI|nr:hypothetical protein [Mucilaginibacter pocheonensis]MDR6942911.1 hypothetical protein [Mucilaginibacter pocheonensis]